MEGHGRLLSCTLLVYLCLCLSVRAVQSAQTGCRVGRWREKKEKNITQHTHLEWCNGLVQCNMDASQQHGAESACTKMKKEDASPFLFLPDRQSHCCFSFDKKKQKIKDLCFPFFFLLLLLIVCFCWHLITTYVIDGIVK